MDLFVNTDVRTLMAILCWTNLVSVVVNITYWATTNSREKFTILKLFTLSKVCQLFAFSLLLLRDNVPDFLTYHLSNSLFFVAMYAEALSIYRELEIRTVSAVRILTGILVLSLLYYNIREYLYTEDAYRIISSCISVLFLIAVPSLHLLFGRGNSTFHRIMGIFYFFFCAMQVLRIAATLGPDFESIDTFSNTPIQSMTFISLLMLNTLSSSVLFLSFKESLDKTNRLRQQELLDSANAEKEANRLKSKFLAAVSHEIRTPLNGILGLTELTASDPGIPENIRGRLERINLSAHGMLRIINDILDASKIESGKIELERIPFTIEEVFAMCNAIIEPKASEKGLNLRFNSTPLPGKKLIGDPTRLRQVLLNLLSNAVKFTQQGTVTLSAHVEGINRNTVTILYEVEDSGVGMTDDQMAKIFLPYTQADVSTQRKYGGTGLGLTIAKEIVELMGGTLNVSSQLGTGSTFSFKIVSESMDVSDSDDDESAPSPIRMTDVIPRFQGEVLVCEDNPINQDVAREHLLRVGLEVFVTDDGSDGVAMAEERLNDGTPFDLILMDINMPGTNGLEAARILQDMGSPSPIVALTAEIIDDDRQSFAEAGIEDCLPKPFSAQELWDCLRKFLPELPPTENASKEGGSSASGSGTISARSQAKWMAVNKTVGLKHAANNKELYTRLCRNFARSKRGSVKEIADALGRNDISAAIFHTHSLKGVAATIGAIDLSRAAATLELLLLDDSYMTGKAQTLLHDVQKALDATIHELER